MNGFGLRLLLLRRLLGVTQDQLAERAGLAPCTVVRIERARHVPRDATIDAIERALAELHAERVLGIPQEAA